MNFSPEERGTELRALFFESANELLQSLNESGLELPHPRLTERAFVLVPLHEIAPNLQITGRGKTVEELLQLLDESRRGETDAMVRIECDHWRAAAHF